MNRAWLFIALLSVAPAFADDVKKPSLVLPTEMATVNVPTPTPIPSVVAPGQLIQIKIAELPLDVAKQCTIVSYPRPVGVVVLTNASWTGEVSILFSAPIAGDYLVAINSPGPTGVVTSEVIVHVVAPSPPPDPYVPPVPVPVVSSNLRVLFMYDALHPVKMQPGQISILTDPAIRAYLNKHCPMEATSCPPGCLTCKLNPMQAAQSPSYLFVDQNINMSTQSQVWLDTITYLKGKNIPLPSLVICNEEGPVYVGPWASDSAAQLLLLKSYGGE